MKVSFFTLGSRGDVQPYLCLAQRLIREGHEAVLCAGESFRALAAQYGVSFSPTASDLMAFAETVEGKAILAQPLKHAALAGRMSREVLNPAYRKTLDDFYAAAREADLIVYHPKALGAVDIALSLGIPCVSMPPVPITWPAEEFPNLAISATGNYGKRLNRLSYRVNAMAERAQMKEINDFRRKSLGLSPRKPGIYAFSDGAREIPTVYPLSRTLFPDVNSWEGHVLLPGFFFSPEGEEALAAEVESFLEAGAPPLVVTFSSMSLRDPSRFLNILREGLNRSGHRAVILTGSSGLQGESDDRICFVKAAPHTLLFPRCMAVLHHGGVGTMAAALRAGKPQLVMPLSTDQPFWAARLQRLGLAGKPLNERTLRPEILAERITAMEDGVLCRAAERMHRQITEEDGTGETVCYLEQLMEEH